MTSAHLILPKYERAIPAWTGSGGNTYLWTTNSVSSVPISQQCPETPPPPTYHINPRAPMDNFTAVQGPINHLQVCDLPFRLLVGLWCFFFFFVVIPCYRLLIAYMIWKTIPKRKYMTRGCGHGLAHFMPRFPTELTHSAMAR